MGIAGTVLLGIIGSFIGGFIGYVLFGKDFDEGAVQASGIVGSIVGAVIALLVYRAATRPSPAMPRSRIRPADAAGSTHAAPPGGGAAAVFRRKWHPM